MNTSVNVRASRWFSVLNERRNASVRMFCFPYAGGGANLYRPWQRDLHADVEVVAVQPPGRGTRMQEPPIRSVQAMVDAIVPDIIPLMDRPCIFFGYSMGGAIAFEVGRALQRMGRSRLELFIAAARRGPTRLPLRPPIHDLPQDEFIERLRTYGATPTEVLENADLLSFILPTIRADFSLSETYRYEDNGLLRCRSLVLGSKSDPYVPWDDLLAWQEAIADECSVREIGEGHFFIHSHADSLAAEVRSAIDALLVAL